MYTISININTNRYEASRETTPYTSSQAMKCDVVFWSAGDSLIRGFLYVIADWRTPCEYILSASSCSFTLLRSQYASTPRREKLLFLYASLLSEFLASNVRPSYNTVPRAIKASDNVDLFKKRLKAHWLIQAFG